MARLMSCPDCRHEVSKTAPACPRCGRVLRRQPRKRGCLGLIGIAVLITFGILVLVSLLPSRGPAPQRGVAPPPAVVSAGSPAAPVIGGSVTLTPADFGGSWPLEASEAVLSCEPARDMRGGRTSHAILLHVDGMAYAVNGTARNQAISNSWKDIGSLLDRERDWQFIGKLVDRGLSLCP